jgi:short-subunit dehydrogenase
MSDRRPLALVTGASSGIGLELARLHAARGGDLVVAARRIDRLEALRDEVADAHGAACEVIGIDLAEPGAPTRLYDMIRERGLELDYLINNAGFGGVGRYHERDWAAHLSMIQVNIVALAELTRAALPSMVERGRGRVLNVASVAGYVPGPLQAVYYASKSFVVSFSEALDEELKATGVTVTALCPGLTDTEFFDAANMGRAEALKFPRASAASVARVGYDGMLKGRRVVISGFQNWLLVHLALRFLPRRLMTRLSFEVMRKRE